MRILLCNKFFFLNGGTEKYLRDLLQYFPRVGHIPIPFSVRYPESWESPYSRYFLPPPTRSGKAHFKDLDPARGDFLRLADRTIYSIEARLKLTRLLTDVPGIQVAYLLNIYNYMSPSILHTLRNHRIPAVIHLGDYHLLCPNYLLLRNGKPCTLCVHGNYLSGVRHRCVKGSLLASGLRVASMYFQKWLRLYDLAEAFVVPCRFMRERLVEGGFPRDRIHLIAYPVTEIGHAQQQTWRKKEYILYFGRISREKGLDILILAYQQSNLPVDLVILGRDYDGEMERLSSLVLPEHAPRIHFLGFKEGAELSRWIGEALYTVVPSRWYDNAPLSIYESFLHQTPVLAADIGGIPEQIEDGVTGRLFSPDSTEGLVEGLQWMLSDRERLDRMGRTARKHVLRDLSVEKHGEKLLELFDQIILASRDSSPRALSTQRARHFGQPHMDGES